ncbi:MAG: sulfatase-like hydrolase/transferase [Clostridia bacterium]|nr:sulfatase-like hydrolase/transferase [Clostridia bacterium]
MTNNKKKKSKLSKRYFWFVFPLAILFYEFILKVKVFGFSFDEGFFFTLLFSLSAGLFMTAVCTFFKTKIANIITIVSLSFFLVLYGSHIVYNEIFKKFYTLFSLQGAGEAIKGFTTSMWKGIGVSIPFILLFIAPLAIYLIFRKKQLKPRRTKPKMTIALLSSSVAIFVLTLVLVNFSSVGTPSAKDLYYHSLSIEPSVRNFGILTSVRLDFQHMFIPYTENLGDDDIVDIPDIPVLPPVVEDPVDEPITEDPVIEEVVEEVFTPVDNAMIIDFETLINTETDSELLAMNKYFSSLTPTLTNEYTGIFEGKNLIFMTCEALSKYAVRPDTTPTLYKMMTEGFYFTNFYNPSWPVSTSDGEYVACTGLIPKSGVWSFYRSGLNNNLMPFCMGNALNPLGYRTLAYHNNDYTYYNRDLSHPNMGYIYKGEGNGLNITKRWPQSDLEMMQLTYNEFMHNTPFHAYYMTVSGHMEYTWIDNSMSSKHKQEVIDLPYSMPVQAYLACNMELDRACEFLLEKLNELGIAEDTVIVMSPDHIPYGLTYEEYSELAGEELSPDLGPDYFESVCIIYCQGMEPIVVDTITCSLDIIPTLCNLFGLEFDSRLLMGYDMLSTAPSLVIFDNYSWFSDAGFYNAKTRTFTPADGLEVDKSYVSTMNTVVANKFKYSARILDRDYYGYLQDKLGLWPQLQD